MKTKDDDEAISEQANDPSPPKKSGGDVCRWPQRTCEHCGQRFAVGNYRNHIWRMHSGAHHCADCPMEFDTYAALRKHNATVHPRLHKCMNCNYTHRLAFQVKRHEIQSHGERAAACPAEGCAVRLPRAQMRRHLSKAHADTSTASSGASKARRAEFDRHAQLRARAHKIFEAVGGVAPKNFRRLSTAASEVDFRCTTCGERRETRDQLRRHIARVHERRYTERQREKRYGCEHTDCERVFTCAVKLEDHLNAVHTGEKPFQCTPCVRQYATRAEYARHLREFHQTTIREVARAATLTADMCGALFENISNSCGPTDRIEKG